MGFVGPWACVALVVARQRRRRSECGKCFRKTQYMFPETPETFTIAVSALGEARALNLAGKCKNIFTVLKAREANGEHEARKAGVPARSACQ